jgi:Calcineurin-like phosphoesterase
MLCCRSLHRVAVLAVLVLSPFSLGCGDSTSKPSTIDAWNPGAPDATVVHDSVQADAGTPSETSGPDLATAIDSQATVQVDGAAGNADGGGSFDLGPSLDATGPASMDAGTDLVKPQLPATIVVLPDTQYYAESYPDTFNLQTSWIVAQKPILNIAVALHVGDIVNFDITQEWTTANPAMRVLDNIVPYDVVPGNHDYSTADRKTMIDNYFSPASMPWITGTMTSGQIENNYMIVDIGPRKWLILGIEFGARDAVLAWADKVLKAYPTTPAILLTHAYLYADGNRYDINIGGTDTTSSKWQAWNPQYYGFSAADGINDGEAMYQKLVLPNSNVKLVFCGHQTGWARRTDTRPDGTTVHQMLSDYQWIRNANNGFGYLRVVQLDYENKKVNVQSYSPSENAYISDSDNQFTLDLNL